MVFAGKVHACSSAANSVCALPLCSNFLRRKRHSTHQTYYVRTVQSLLAHFTNYQFTEALLQTATYPKSGPIGNWTAIYMYTGSSHSEGRLL